MPVIRSGTPLPEALSSATDAPPPPRKRAITILTSDDLYQARRKYELYGSTPAYAGLPQHMQRSELDAMLLRDPITVQRKHKARMTAQKEERERKLAEIDIKFNEIRKNMPRPIITPLQLTLTQSTPIPEPTKKRGNPLTRSSSIRDFTAENLELTPTTIVQAEPIRRRARPLSRTTSSRDLTNPPMAPLAPTPSPTTPTSRSRSQRRSRTRPYPQKKPRFVHVKLERTYSFGSLKELKAVAAIKEDEAVLEALALRNSPPPEPAWETIAECRELLRKPPVYIAPMRGFFVCRPGCGMWWKVFVPEDILYEDPDEEDLRNMFPGGYDDRMKDAVTRREPFEGADGNRPLREFFPCANPLER